MNIQITPDPNQCPVSVMRAFEAYIDDGLPPGDFIRACLENNLLEAFHRADTENLQAIPHIVAWLYWNMPSNLWKSQEVVSHHIDAMADARSKREK